MPQEDWQEWQEIDPFNDEDEEEIVKGLEKLDKETKGEEEKGKRELENPLAALHHCSIELLPAAHDHACFACLCRSNYFAAHGRARLNSLPFRRGHGRVTAVACPCATTPPVRTSVVLATATVRLVAESCRVSGIDRGRSSQAGLESYGIQKNQ